MRNLTIPQLLPPAPALTPWRKIVRWWNNIALQKGNTPVTASSAPAPLFLHGRQPHCGPDPAPVHAESAESLELYVLYTSPQRTRTALAEAGRAAADLQARITLLIPFAPNPWLGPFELRQRVCFLAEQSTYLLSTFGVRCRAQLWDIRQGPAACLRQLPASTTLVLPRRRWWVAWERELRELLLYQSHHVF